MKKSIVRGLWGLGLWLGCIGHAMAFDLNAPETLRYAVYWGPFAVGNARLDYTPNGAAYALKAEVWDDSRLIDLHDVWESTGVHEAGAPFTPRFYHVVQAENNYRSDKTMTFDPLKKQVVYSNHRDASDKAEPLVLGEARDVLSTVYAWRAAGDVAKAERVPVVSLKKQIVLQRAAAVRDEVRLGTRDVTAWRVRLTTLKDGKAGKDVWTVYVDDKMVPLKIVASTKFGTFSAVLKK